EEKEEEIKLEILEKIAVKKPPVGKVIERFLTPRIDIQSKLLDQRIFERFSIVGDQKIDTFDIEIDKTDIIRFYSPTYFTRILINIERVIKEDTIKFPIQIREEMIRTFDLTKNIEWNSTTVEGIYPPSVSAKELNIQPQEDLQFHELSKEFIEKLPANLIWYFTNTPIPEADKIYRNRLQKFEQQELEKIAGEKAPKGLSRLSKEISRLEERFLSTKGELEKIPARLESLEAEYQTRKAKDLPVKAINRSIESSRTKLERYNEIISDLKQKLLEAENKRQDIMKEQKSIYNEFHMQIEVLKSKSTPRDLYRPDTEDIEIKEEAIYWIPRALVPVSFKRNNISKSLVVNLNLYNGNAEIICKACGPDISTEDYFQSLIKSEISPPIFVCPECLDLFCSDHVNFCTQCNRASCLEHTLECSKCGKIICIPCQKICTGCGETFCEEHLVICKGCGELVCSNCGRIKARVKGREIIAKCINCS
ncbi:MAG: hypothetical protein ACFFBD_08585, partial [Candidatus Hodarchaeota archaeon]